MSQSTESAPPPDRQPLSPNVKILGTASLLNDVASEIIYPLLPAFLLKVVGGTKLDLGILDGLAETVSSLLKLFSGSFSDRAGSRKGFVLFGYGLAALARPLMALVAYPWQVLLVRLGDRIGKGIRTSPRDAMIADSSADMQRGRAFGFHRAMDHLGAAIGPLIATAFLWFWPENERTLFLLTIIPGLLVVTLLIFGLKEPARKGEKKEPLRLTLKPFDRNFKIFLIALVVFSLGNSSDMFLLVRAGELGVPTYLLPMLWFVFHVAKSTGNYFVGGLVDRFSPRPLIFLGWFVYALIYLGFGLITSAWQVWIFFLAYALFYALTEPAEKTLVTNLVPANQRGLAFGWFNLAIGISAFPSSVLFGLLYEYLGALVAFSWGAGLALAAAGILYLVKGEKENRLY